VIQRIPVGATAMDSHRFACEGQSKSSAWLQHADSSMLPLEDFGLLESPKQSGGQQAHNFIRDIGKIEQTARRIVKGTVLQKEHCE
jgi:hypothetical protein